MRALLLATILFLGFTALGQADQDQVPTAVRPLSVQPTPPPKYDIPSEPKALYLGIIAAAVFGVLVYAYKTSGKK